MAWTDPGTATRSGGRVRWPERRRFRSTMRRAGRRVRHGVTVVMAPVLGAGTAIPAVAMAVTATAAAVVVAGPALSAKAAASTPVLVLLQNGQSTAPETTILQNAGYAVTQATPAQWLGMSKAQFQGYAALVIGDPSSGTCSALVPTTGTTGSDAIGTTWQGAVTGNLAILGTAPALSGSSAANTLIADAIAYTAEGWNSSSNTGTGLYESLNCGYSTAAANTNIPLLNGVEGISSSNGLAVQGSLACTDNGTVNSWEAANAGTFSGFTSGSLAAGAPAWPSPACPVQEAFDTWPGKSQPWPGTFTPVAYDAAADAAANFTASDDATGQPYILLGSPVAPTPSLAPSTGGQVPSGTASGGGGNPAVPGLSQPVANGVNTENGDFTQSATDLSIPTFGPSLSFSRSYDSQVAQQQVQTGQPGPMGYGWTDNWASSLTTVSPTPGDIYTVEGLRTHNGDGGPPSGVAGAADVVTQNGSDVYIADLADNRILEIPATSKTQWGRAMTAGDMYAVAGSITGQLGATASGHSLSGFLLNAPQGLGFDSHGNMIIADSGNDRILVVPAASGTYFGVSMTAGNVYQIAGHNGTAGNSGDGAVATGSFLNQPTGVSVGHSGADLYIADTGNSRIQEIYEGSQSWGQTMTAGDIYTVAGQASGASGTSGDGGAATSGHLNFEMGVAFDSSGDMYIADTGNNRVQEVAAATGTQWGVSMTANDVYTVAGQASGASGTSGDGGAATSADLNGPITVQLSSTKQLYIADSINNRIQEVAATAHTEWGIAMTANNVYTIAGNSGGACGFSGDGGTATAAKLCYPVGLFVSSSAMYIADEVNNRVRQVSTSDVISEYAGDGWQVATAGNGAPAVRGALFNPEGEAFDSAGNIYIADAWNNRIQEIAARSQTQFGITMNGGDVYTVAGDAHGSNGTSGNGGLATSAFLFLPQSIASDKAGNLYIADSDNCRIQKLTASTGIISTLAGSAAGTCGTYSGEGGVANLATLSQMQGVVLDPQGDIFIADTFNNRVEEVYKGGQSFGQTMTSGHLYTVAGTGTQGFSGDSAAATSAQLSEPDALGTDAQGNLYISDWGNNRIREVPVASGSQRGRSMTKYDIYTIAGNGTAGTAGNGGPATSANLNGPGNATVDPAGDVYISDTANNRVQEVPVASGTQWGQAMTANDAYTVAGSATGASGNSGDGGPATSAKMTVAENVSLDPEGDLYITDHSDNLLREVASATPATIAPAPGLTSALNPPPAGITVTQAGGAQVTFYAQSGGACPTAPYTQVAGGYCALPQDTGASLTFNSTSSTWTFKPQPDTSYTYNSSGQLTSEADAAGDTLTLSYATPAPGSGNCPSSAASCETITSASGRALVLGLNSAGEVTTATDPMGRAWTYGYAGSNLTSATDPMSNVTSYGYDTGNANPLLTSDITTITKPNGQSGGPNAGVHTAIGWTTSGQAASVTDPMGYKASYDTSGFNPATGTGFITATDAGGYTTDYYYLNGTLAAQSDWTGTTMTSELDYVPDQSTTGTQLVVSVSDGNGNTTSTVYANGNPVSSTAPDGIGNQTATTTQQFTSLNQADCSSDAGATTTCSGSGGPAAVSPGGSITPPSTIPPIGVTWTLYDTHGNQLYTTVGVYPPGGSTASYSKTTYQLFNGNSVTLNGTSDSCTATAPSPSLPCATIDADANVTQLAYDSAGDLASSSTPDGNGTEVATTAYAYDGDGEQTSTTTPDGNLSGANAGNYTTTTSYNADGQSTSVTRAGGSGATVTPRTTNNGYDGNGNKTTVQDARGYTTTTTYNADDQAALVTDPDLHATLTCYDPDGHITQTVPPAGVASGGLTPASCPSSYPSGYGNRLASDATTYTYNGHGEKTAMTTPAPAGQSGSESTTYSYDGDGNLTQTTAPPATTGGSSQVTVDAYDSAGRLASQTTGYGTSAAATYSYCYDPAGHQTSVVYPDGNTSAVAPCETSSPWVVSPTANPVQAAFQTTSSYDSAGELASGTSPATAAAPSGATTTYTYDAAGNKLTSTDPDGVITSYAYTPRNMEASASYSEVSSATVGGTAGPLVSALPPSTGSLCLDDFHSLTSAGNVIDIYTCNQSGAQAWTVNPDGTLQVLGNCLDVSGNGTALHTLVVLEPCSASTPGEIWHAGQHGSWVNPNSGKCLDDPASTTTPGTQVQIYTCNGTSAQDWASIQYRHDASGNVTAMSDASGTSSYVNDPFGEVTSATNGAGQATGYGYDPNGDTTSVTYPLPASATWATTSTVVYGYDHADELTGVTDFSGNPITISNTADAKPNSVSLGATGDTIATTYDSTDAPSATALNNGTTTLQSFTYAEAPSAAILSETDTPASAQSPAVYTYDAKGRVTSMTPGSGPALNYGFDPSSNLTTLPTTATATYDNAGELTSSALSGTTTNYTYNADGQRLIATIGSTTAASGTWNGAGELTGYSNTTASMSAAVYDGNGLRASATITPSGQSATTQQYVWNTKPAIPEMIMDSSNAYIYEHGVAPIEQVNISTGAITYLVTDALGSARGAVNSSGVLTGTTSYEAWGNPQTPGGLTSTTPFGFAGGYTDAGGLIYLLARYYDPATGQFLSVDPLVSQTSQAYEYAYGDPVQATDPTGRCPGSAWWSFCLIGAVHWYWEYVKRYHRYLYDGLRVDLTWLGYVSTINSVYDAWDEVVNGAGRRADANGMFNQFACHWVIARNIPGRPFHLDSWRPDRGFWGDVFSSPPCDPN
jgi:RHS repeat-associated protein